ncbi:MAG: hypothetical protein AABX78_01130 [Nanoarchaeota archaeon]
MDPMCHDGYCAKCHGAKWVVFGLILIVNQLYLRWDIWVVLGVLIVLKGIMKLAMPACSHCQPSMAMKKGRK